MDAATAIAAVVALVGSFLLGIALDDAIDVVLAFFESPSDGVDEEELLLATCSPTNTHHMRTRLRAALEEAEEEKAESALRLRNLPFALVRGLFQAVGRVFEELVDGMKRVLALVLVMFASAGSFLLALGATLGTRVVRPCIRLMNGRGAPPAAQVQVVQVPRIALDSQLFGQGFLATHVGKVHQLASSEGFFRAVAEHIEVPACADLALDMYAVALGLNADWRGLTVDSVMVQVLCEAVHQLTQVVAHEQVVDAAVVVAPATGAAVADALLQQVHWVLFTHRPFNDAIRRTIPADVRIIGRREGWDPRDMARMTHTSRIATALGVAGRQHEIVAAACVILSDTAVEVIVHRHRYNRAAVENAVTQITELGVVELLDLVAP